MRKESRNELRVDVLGVGISVTTVPGVCRVVTNWIERRAQAYVCVTGVHGVMESQRDPQLLEVHNASGLTVPDGVPMVWAGRYAGASEIERVYGPDMMSAVCELAAELGWQCFFYGGAPGTADRVAERLVARFPGLRVAGVYRPPFRELTGAEDEEVTRLITASGADLVWVGLSTPKQERWMAAHVGRFDPPCILFGVGAAFDIHAGLRHDAPNWVRKLGLHWLFRLLQEPRRLWKRYAMNNPAFLVSVLRRRPRLVTHGGRNLHRDV